MDFKVSSGVVFGADVRRFSGKIERGDDFGAILGRIFAGSIFHRIFIVLELVWTGKIKQNHCTVIKNQGFAKVSEIWFGVRFFIDFGVTLGRFWQEIEALEGFLREKTSFKITSKIGVDFHGIYGFQPGRENRTS